MSLYPYILTLYQSISAKRITHALYQNMGDLMANPVDYDTRDGCTRLGAGAGAMHLMTMFLPASFQNSRCIKDRRLPHSPKSKLIY